MIRHFCDVCGQELLSNNDARAEFTGGTRSTEIRGKRIEVVIEAKIVDGDHHADLCTGCAFDAVKLLDTRDECSPLEAAE